MQTSTVKLANGSYILSVFNYPSSTPVETVASQINQALDSANVKSHSKVELVSQNLVAKKTVSVRFPSNAHINEKELQAALNQVGLKPSNRIHLHAFIACRFFFLT